MKLNKKDLRLGNSIQGNLRGTWIHTIVDIVVLGTIAELNSTEYKGIPIDEENLQKLGFNRVTVQQAENQVFYAHGIHLRKTITGWVANLESTHTFREIHKLQNFMYEITGKEMSL